MSETQKDRSQEKKSGYGGASKSGASKTNTSKGTYSGASKSSSAKSGAQKSGGTKSGTSKSAYSGTSKSGSAKSGSQKSGSAKSGTSKSAYGGASKSSSAKSGAQKSNSSKSTNKSKYSGVSKSGSAKSGSKKSSASKSGYTKKNTTTRSKGKNDTWRSSHRDTEADRNLRSSHAAMELKRRRMKNSYNSHRRRNSIIVYSMMALVLICMAIVMSTTILFNISKVTVNIEENVPYTEEQILMHCDIKPGMNMFTISTKKNSENITTKLPYIDTCEIKRKLPSSITISAQAAEVMGIAMTSTGQRVVLSTTGRVLEVLTGGTTSDAPLLSGMVVTRAELGSRVDIENDSQLEVASTISAEMLRHGLKPDSIMFLTGGKVKVGYDRRLTLVIGTPTKLAQKIELAAHLINSGKISKNESGDIGLTIPGKCIFTPDYLKKEDDINQPITDDSTAPSGSDTVSGSDSE